MTRKRKMRATVASAALALGITGVAITGAHPASAASATTRPQAQSAPARAPQPYYRLWRRTVHEGPFKDPSSWLCMTFHDPRVVYAVQWIANDSTGNSVISSNTVMTHGTIFTLCAYFPRNPGVPTGRYTVAGVWVIPDHRSFADSQFVQATPDNETESFEVRS